MRTKAAAIAKCRKLWKTFGPFVVYQFPRGHWSYASLESPIGRDLQATGYIYPQIGSKARQWEIVPN